MTQNTMTCGWTGYLSLVLAGELAVAVVPDTANTIIGRRGGNDNAQDQQERTSYQERLHKAMYEAQPVSPGQQHRHRRTTDTQHVARVQ